MLNTSMVCGRRPFSTIDRSMWIYNITPWYLQAKVHMRGVKTVADDCGFSHQSDFIRGASFGVAPGQRVFPAVLLSVEGHRHLLLFPRL